MPDHVYLNQIDNIKRISSIIATSETSIGESVMVSFASRGTHHPLLIVPMKNAVHVGFEGRYPGTNRLEIWFYVVLFEYGHSYPFVLGHLNPDYVAQKLKIHHYGTALDITVFLNALNHPKGVEAYLKTIPIIGDHINEEEYRDNG